MNPADANFPMRIWSEAVMRGLFTAIWGMKVSGLENVPRLGPLIVACNHVSIIDPPLMAVAVSPRRRPFGVGKKELFEKPILGWWLRASGSFPLDRQGDATSAMRSSLGVLEKGGCLSIYPEGTRVKPSFRCGCWARPNSRDAVRSKCASGGLWRRRDRRTGRPAWRTRRH